MNQEVQDLKNALRQSLHKIRDLKSSLEAVENASSEPIAIVGMSCRGPGGLTSPESYWSLLERGGDGVGPLPDRWSRDLLRSSTPASSASRRGKRWRWIRSSG
jgi:hypothetical protein